MKMPRPMMRLRARGRYFHDAGVGQRGDREPHGRPADLHEGGQATLAREAVALAQLAGADAVHDLAQHILERLARPDGREQLLGRRRHQAIVAARLDDRSDIGKYFRPIMVVTAHEHPTRLWRRSRPRSAYQVVIVGAGGHGLATAYYLAKRHGITDVAVVDHATWPAGNVARNTHARPGPTTSGTRAPPSTTTR